MQKIRWRMSLNQQQQQKQRWQQQQQQQHELGWLTGHHRRRRRQWWRWHRQCQSKWKWIRYTYVCTHTLAPTDTYKTTATVCFIQWIFIYLYTFCTYNFILFNFGFSCCCWYFIVVVAIRTWPFFSCLLCLCAACACKLSTLVKYLLLLFCFVLFFHFIFFGFCSQKPMKKRVIKVSSSFFLCFISACSMFYLAWHGMAYRMWHVVVCQYAIINKFLFI